MNESSRAACFSSCGRPAVDVRTHPLRIRGSHRRNGTMCAVLGAMLVAGSSAPAGAQNTPAPPNRRTMPEPPQQSSNAQARLEESFTKAMTQVVLQGTWRMTGKDGKLTEPRDDRYHIISVSKGFADNWVISARMRFGENEVTMPFPVRVVWAGDTPIITVDNFAVPGVGTYSARVMIYRDYYCGSWFGKGYSGIMSGRIVPADEVEKKTETPPADESPAEGKTKSEDKTEPRP